MKTCRSPTSGGGGIGGKTGNGTSFDEERDEEYFCLRPKIPGNGAGTFAGRSDDSDHTPDIIPDAFLGGELRTYLRE